MPAMTVHLSPNCSTALKDNSNYHQGGFNVCELTRSEFCLDRVSTALVDGGDDKFYERGYTQLPKDVAEQTKLAINDQFKKIAGM